MGLLPQPAVRQIFEDFAVIVGCYGNDGHEKRLQEKSEKLIELERAGVAAIKKNLEYKSRFLGQGFVGVFLGFTYVRMADSSMGTLSQYLSSEPTQGPCETQMAFSKEYWTAGAGFAEIFAGNDSLALTLAGTLSRIDDSERDSFLFPLFP